MKIQVLGSGCSNCKKLFELTKVTITQIGLKEEVDYVTDVTKIIEMGVMSSPVLAIDGNPVMVGFVPDIEKIKKLITNNSTAHECDCKDSDYCCEEDCKCNSKTDEKKLCTCGGNC